MGALTCGRGKATGSRIRAGAHANCDMVVGRACIGGVSMGWPGTGAKRIRSPRRRLPELPDPERRSGRMRQSMRARCALPGLEFLLSAYGQCDRHMLAEEPGSATH